MFILLAHWQNKCCLVLANIRKIPWLIWMKYRNLRKTLQTSREKRDRHLQSVNIIFRSFFSFSFSMILKNSAKFYSQCFTTIQYCNHWKNIIDKFTKLSKIDFLQIRYNYRYKFLDILIFLNILAQIPKFAFCVARRVPALNCKHFRDFLKIS